MGRHVEAFVITAKNVKISMLPWVQADKAGATGASGTRSMLERAQKAYATFYFDLDVRDRGGLPLPLPPGSLLTCVENVQSDNAVNESKREDVLEEMIGHSLNRAKCLHHNIMLMAKSLRKDDHACLSGVLGNAKDSDSGIRTNNIVDSLQFQLGKLFGHHPSSYVFGDGDTDFPQWMRENQTDRWKGMWTVRASNIIKNARVQHSCLPACTCMCALLRLTVNIYELVCGVCRHRGIPVVGIPA